MHTSTKTTALILFCVLTSCAESRPEAHSSPHPENRFQLTESNDQTNGSFSLLIYNIAGLPWVVSSSDPTENTALIGPLLNGYDVVLVQEDFWYHDELRPHLKHRFQSKPQDDEPSVFDLHDGLNRFAKFEFGRLTRTTWTECEGYLTDSCDCLARKGFSSSEMRLSDGASVLVYNVHLDAGENDGNVEARRVQFDQLAADIKKRGEGKALFVAGDTNVLFENKKDTKNFTNFLGKIGLTDSCDTLNCDERRLDKILFRSSDQLTLTAESRTIPTEFVDADSEDLSDHKPVSVVFNWEAKF